MLIALIVLTLLLLISRLPIFIALSLPAAFLIVFFGNIPLTIFAQQMFSNMDRFSLMSMPFFVLAANIMTVGGLSRRIVNWVLCIVGSVRGGLGMGFYRAAGPAISEHYAHGYLAVAFYFFDPHEYLRPIFWLLCGWGPRHCCLGTLADSNRYEIWH
jgi:hypothetical protein